MNLLELENLRVLAGENEIISGVSIAIKPGEVHMLMGKNGSGKSTLLSALAGSPKYDASGIARFGGNDLLSMKPHERSRRGLFLAFQHPSEVQGVQLSNFLRRAYVARHGKEISVSDFEKVLADGMKLLSMNAEFANRELNFGFSGGEKKMSELLQMAILAPRLAMLDELDSGLDIDAAKRMTGALSKMRERGMAMIIVTHYGKLMRELKPQCVHVMQNGRIAASGGVRLAEKVENEGYGWIGDG